MADSKLKIWIADHYDGVGIKKLMTQLGTVKSKISSAFSSKPVLAFKIAVAGVVGILLAAGKSAVDFNIQMARVNTMAGGGIQNFKELRAQAKGLASDYGLAASSISKGMYNALSAGVEKANLEAVMNTAAQIAVADGSDISVAIDGLTTVLNAFGYSAEESEDVADKLFQTVKSGKTTFGELAATIATVAPVAAASNIPLEEILAHVAALTASGTPTAQAMTQIRASIIGLNKALGDGWSANMSYQDALKAVWSQAGQSQTKLLELVGSTEAVQAVLGGVGDKAAVAADKLQGMADTAGNVKAAFDEVDQFRHWSPLIATAWETLKKLGAELDERIAPYVRQVTAEIKKWQTDEGLWDNIRGALDSMIDVLSQIKNFEDIKTALGVTGEWMKEKLIEGLKIGAAYLLENAPLIGNAIGEGAKSAMTAAVSGPIDNLAAGAVLMMHGKAPSSDNREMLINAKREGELAQSGVDAAAQVSISDASSQSLADRITSALEEQASAEAEASKSDAERLLDIMSTAMDSNMSGSDLQDALAGLTISTDDFNEIVKPYLESVDGSMDAMQEAAEAATKSSNAAHESNKTVIDALEKNTQASALSTQAAQSAIEFQTQNAAVLSAVISQQSALTAKLSSLESLVRRSRV
jgi:TP901 family phage tail tape measure protein